GFIVGGDAFIEMHPLRTVFWSAIRRGELLVWTPHIFSGYPLLSIAQLAVGYPLTWGYLFLPSHVAEEIYVLAPFLLSPLFTYAYAREINLSRTASLLAGLSFGYGGMMTIANGVIGLPTNGLMWLPLVLVALERARRREGGGFLRPLIFATLAFSMSVLNGHGQSFVYAGALAAAYALFLSFIAFERGEGRDPNRRGLWLRRLRPPAVCLGAFVLSAGVAAFQILETLRAARRSVRSALTYETFTEGSFTLRQAALSFVAPLYNFIDVTAYVSPLAFLLALLAVACALRGRRHGSTDALRVYFWFGVACVAFVLMLGANTPLYRLVYYAPLLNKFRVPSRHAFEWTFALSILAACGWDSAARLFASRQSASGNTRRKESLSFLAALVLVLLATLVGAYWFRAAAPTPDTQGMTKLTTLAESSYIALKAAFTASTLLLFWLAWSVAGDFRRKALLLSVVLMVSFVEPYILVNRWWSHFVKPASRFARVAPVTRLLQQFPPAEGRVYTRFSLYLDEFLGSRAPFDAQNRTALYGLHNVAGYDPLILERYSRALGDVNFDGVTARRASPDNPALISSHSHVLDLLNTRFLVTFANFSTALHRPPISVDAADVMASGRWEAAHAEGNVVVLRNTRTLPRAWLASEAEAIGGEEALRLIRGDEAKHEGKNFDPRRTALLEVAPQELPALAGGELAAGSGASVVAYDANHIAIETKADKPSVLVVSEIFYPGWEATVDGQPAPIRLTDYLLRGVYLEAGSHRVEMRYRAPALRNGALISLATLLLLCVLGVVARRGGRAGGG
ncbi:MAG TPA: YfhO family protein, partial [Pyrinomonadaceae bacterium]|nr:YfhO family protein [Pyrinomonadaceae bacterium]